MSDLASYAGQGAEPVLLAPLGHFFIGPYLIPKRHRITIAEIQARVARHFGCHVSDLISARRANSRARQVAMYVSRHRTLNSFPEIGKRFGGRDHTTVMHAIWRIDLLRQQDPEFDAEVRGLMAGTDTLPSFPRAGAM